MMVSLPVLTAEDVGVLKRAFAGDNATPAIIEALCSSKSTTSVRQARHDEVCSMFEFILLMNCRTSFSSILNTAVVELLQYVYLMLVHFFFLMSLVPSIFVPLPFSL